MPGCPIRRPADQRELAPPRRFSQLAASFIAARCQGIRRAPVYAWPKALASGASVYIRCNSDSQTIQFSKINPHLEGNGFVGRLMVGVPGIGPGTSSLSGTRSNQLSYTPILGGGGSRVRTGDIQLAKLALYRLSYAPLSGYKPGGR